MRLIVGALAFLVAAACTTQAESTASADNKEEGGFGKLSIDEVAAKLGQKGVYVFDNNGHDEYLEGHVPTASWVDYKNVTAKELPADKEATLIFYCHNEH